MQKKSRIAVFTSGGDAPGMNAAIRAVARTGFYYGMEVYGILRGYQGLIDNDFSKLDNYKVANIIQHGGTILKSKRSEEFRTKEGRQKAFENLSSKGIEALVAIGGDGTFTGADIFGKEYTFPVVGIPGTIDNDLYGTDFTIGYDTAINTVVQAVDKIRDTAGSHNRLFFIEVMGRDAGFIALRSGIATGAEDILIPETETSIEGLINKLKHDRRENKTSGIIMVSEGDDAGNAYEVA
ncbi:MAG: ATP-dependent 6-phosphofructokinase, partial [Bacteroidales bacterium]